MNTLITSRRPTDRLRLAAAAFGLRPVHRPKPTAQSRPDTRTLDACRRAADRILDTLAPGQTLLLSGPSGSGKSTALALLNARLARRKRPRYRVDHRRPALQDRCVIDLVPGDPAQACRALARAGLGDATLLGRTPNELSEGQRMRLRLAIAMTRAEATPGTWILIDEAWSTLDEPTAFTTASALRRWAKSARVRVVSAGSPERLADLLQPDALVYLGVDSSVHTIERGRA
ncbi:MAG: ATP-binding cassette domain-containing protein [Phycisphaerales bacterium]|nr:ATP-binding cassette domain-containing protein [Phycisphaerales bacterium]